MFRRYWKTTSLGNNILKCLEMNCEVHGNKKTSASSVHSCFNTWPCLCCDRPAITAALLVFTGRPLAAQTLLSKSPLRRRARQSRVGSESPSDNAGHSPMTTLKGIWENKDVDFWSCKPPPPKLLYMWLFPPFYRALRFASAVCFKILRLKSCGNVAINQQKKTKKKTYQAYV